MNKELYQVMIINILITLVTVLLQEYDRIRVLSKYMVIAIFVAFFSILALLICIKMEKKNHEKTNKIGTKRTISDQISD